MPECLPYILFFFYLFSMIIYAQMYYFLYKFLKENVYSKMFFFSQIFTRENVFIKYFQYVQKVFSQKGTYV